jgi:hypothetical protein
MSVAALFSWMATIAAGLVLLVIWIIEYDHDFQSTAATRLPVPVISAHAMLGLFAILLWVGYLLLGAAWLAWATVAAVGTVATLGLTLAARWFRVYRTFAHPGPAMTRRTPAPPERSFPLPVVAAHGILALSTVALVLITVLGETSG